MTACTGVACPSGFSGSIHHSSGRISALFAGSKSRSPDHPLEGLLFTLDFTRCVIWFQYVQNSRARMEGLSGLCPSFGTIAARHLKSAHGLRHGAVTTALPRGAFHATVPKAAHGEPSPVRWSREKGRDCWCSRGINRWRVCSGDGRCTHGICCGADGTRRFGPGESTAPCGSAARSNGTVRRLPQGWNGFPFARH